MLKKLHTKVIVQLMHSARLHVQWPKIKLQSKNGTIQLSVAGNKSKLPNSINITDGNSYPNNKYYGRIFVDGTIKLNSIYSSSNDIISHELELFAENPTQYAKLYSSITGNCMFCSRELTDPQSVAVGYGPICASHYGLPHGDIETEVSNELAQIEMPMPEIKLPNLRPALLICDDLRKTTIPIIDKLGGARIVHLGVDNNERNSGSITIMEACDHYFDCTLTKAEYIQLGNEILKEAEKL